MDQDSANSKKNRARNVQVKSSILFLGSIQVLASQGLFFSGHANGREDETISVPSRFHMPEPGLTHHAKSFKSLTEVPQKLSCPQWSGTKPFLPNQHMDNGATHRFRTPLIFR